MTKGVFSIYSCFSSFFPSHLEGSISSSTRRTSLRLGEKICWEKILEQAFVYKLFHIKGSSSKAGMTLFARMWIQFWVRRKIFQGGTIIFISQSVLSEDTGRILSRWSCCLSRFRWYTRITCCLRSSCIFACISCHLECDSYLRKHTITIIWMKGSLDTRTILSGSWNTHVELHWRTGVNYSHAQFIWFRSA